MGSIYSAGTLVRGADGVLYEVSTGGGRPTQEARHGSSSGDARMDSPQAAQSADHAASRMVIEPGDHGASRMVIEPGDHEASRMVIEPGDLEASRMVIEPGDHAAA